MRKLRNGSQRLAALLLALCMVAALLPTGALAAGETDGVSYNESSKTLTLGKSMVWVSDFDGWDSVAPEAEHLVLENNCTYIEDAVYAKIYCMTQLKDFQILGGADDEKNAGNAAFRTVDGVLYEGSDQYQYWMLKCFPPQWEGTAQGKRHVIPPYVQSVYWQSETNNAFAAFKGDFDDDFDSLTIYYSKTGEYAEALGTALGNIGVPHGSYSPVTGARLTSGGSRLSPTDPVTIPVWKEAGDEYSVGLSVWTGGDDPDDSSEPPDGDALGAVTVVGWTSSDPSVAAVTPGDGLRTASVKGLKSGSVTVRVEYSYLDGEGQTATGYASCAVTVDPQPVDGIDLFTAADYEAESFTNPLTELRLGLLEETGAKHSEKVYGRISPEGATNENFTWANYNENVVTMVEAADGKSVTLTAKAPGVAKIVATTADGGKTGVCTVTVAPTMSDAPALELAILNDDDNGAEVTELELTRSQPLTAQEVALEATVELSAVIKQNDASLTAPNQPYPVGLEWYSSRPEVAAVAPHGDNSAQATVTTAGPGITDIVARTETGEWSACRVTVFDTPTGIRIEPHAESLTPRGAGVQLNATVLPETADQRVTWAITKTEQASVTGGVLAWTEGGTAPLTLTEGFVTPAASVDKISRYELTVTAPAQGRDETVYKESCLITVWEPVTGVLLVRADGEDEPLTLDASGADNTNATGTLKAVVTPDGATEQAVEWTSLNTDIVTVTADPAQNTATVTAVAPGTATVQARTVDGGKIATYKVTVKPLAVGVYLNLTRAAMGLTGTLDLNATVLPENAAYKSIKWSVSEADGVAVTPDAEDPTKAEVKTENAKETSGAPIEVTVTVTPRTGGTACTATCEIEIERIPVERVTLSDYEMRLELGGTKNLTATVSGPTNGEQAATPTSDAVSWSRTTRNDQGEKIEDHNVSLSDMGDEKTVTVTGDKVGTTLVTVTTTDGKFTANCAVTVKPRTVRTVELSAVKTGTEDAYAPDLADSGSLGGTLTATVTPKDPTEQTIYWYSSDEAVVKVSDVDGNSATTALREDGKASVTLTAQAVGRAEIYAVTKDGGITQRYVVNVADTRVIGVKLDKTELTLTLPKTGVAQTLPTGTLTATATPLAAGESRAVTWSVDPADTAVLSVDSNGVVTGKQAGTAKVIVTTVDKDKNNQYQTAECAVTVVRAVESVTIEKNGTGGPAIDDSTPGRKSVILERTDSSTPEITLSAVLTPAAGTVSNKNVRWRSSDESVAQLTVVSQDGATVTVQGKGVGTAAIVAITEDGGYTDTLNVLVRGQATVVTLNKTALRLEKGGKEALRAAVTPDTADQGILWYVTDESATAPGTAAANTAVSVDRGEVTALAEGKAKVWAVSAVDSAKYACCAVTVAVPVGDFTLTPGTLSLTEGGTGNLTPTVTGAEGTTASNAAITWTSSDADVADVTRDEGGNAVYANGKVTVEAKKAGVATIIARTADGGKVQTCTVTVLPTVESVSINTGNGVELNADGSAKSLSLLPGAAYRLDAAVTLTGISPTGEPAATVTWDSSNPAVAVVNSSGVVTATDQVPEPWNDTATYSAVITARSTADSTKTDTCTVTLTKQPVTSLTLDRNSVSLTIGDTATLTGTLLPDNATVTDLTWSVQPAGVVTLEPKVGGPANQYTVTGVKAGTAVVTVTSAGANAQGRTYSASCAVTVEPTRVNAISLLNSDGTAAPALTLDLTAAGSGSGRIKAAVGPAGASDPSVRWTSSDPAVVDFERNTDAEQSVKYNEDGTVTVKALKEGSATVIATTVDGGLTASCAVTVTTHLSGSGVQLQKTALNMKPNDTDVLVAILTPADAADKGLTWTVTEKVATEAGSFSANSVVKVVAGANGTATVTALAAGEAKVWVTASDGGKTAVCDVTVTVHTDVERVSIGLPDPLLAGVERDESVSGRNALLVTGTNKTVQLTATVLPGTATDKTVTWDSTNKAVAVVDSDGGVTVHSAGQTVISVISKDGGKADTLTLTVQEAVTAVSVSAVGLTTDRILDLVPNDKVMLAPRVSPAAADQRHTWTVTDSDAAAEVVSLDEDTGLLTANSPGTATVTLKSVRDTDKTFVISVTVTAAKVPVTGLTLKDAQGAALTALTLAKKGDTAAVTAEVAPDNADDKTVEWSTTDGNVVSVIPAEGTLSATLKAEGSGRATVIARTADGGFMKTVDVTVPEVKPTEITVQDAGGNPVTAPLTLDLGASVQLGAAVTPADAANSRVKWSSGSEAVLVDGTGKVTAVKRIDTPVTVTAASDELPDVTASVTVNVNSKATGVTLSAGNLNLVKGDVAQVQVLTATVQPAFAVPDLRWESDNTGVATVEGGAVTAVGKGTANITVTAQNSDGTNGEKVHAVCAVTVTENASGLTLDQGSVNLSLLDNDSKTRTLTATLSPAASADKVRWTVVEYRNAGGTETGVVSLSDTETDVAPVSGTTNGTAAVTVTALAVGTAVVEASAGGRSQRCFVTVNAVPVAGVEITTTPIPPLVISDNSRNTLQLAAQVAPATATDGTVTWMSLNEDVATVDKTTGLVTAVSGGAAKIVASAGGKTAQVTVTVQTDVTGVTLNEKRVTLNTTDNHTFLLTAAVEPAGAYSSAVTWTVTPADSGLTLEKVEGGVRLTADRTGSFTVTAESVGLNRSGNTEYATCTVTVTAEPVTRIALGSGQENLDLELSSADPKVTLTASVLPAGAADQSISWAIVGTAAAFDGGAVTATGDSVVVRGVSPGTARVTAASGGYSATSVITVKPIPVNGLSLTRGDGTALGETDKTLTGTLSLKAVIDPANASNSVVRWRSSDPAVASVSPDTGAGVTVNKLAPGTATIFAATADGGHSASWTVTVPQPVTGVKLNEETLTLNIGDSLNLVALVEPANAANRAVTWSSGDDAKVEVDNNGKVYAKAATTGDGVTVTAASAEDGTIQAVCRVKVNAAAAADLILKNASGAVVADGAALTLEQKTSQNPNAVDSLTLTAQVTPADAENMTVKWTSGNPAVIKVNDAASVSVQSGEEVTVKAAGAGTATLIARSESGGLVRTVNVSVSGIDVTGITLKDGDTALTSSDVLTLELNGRRPLTAVLTPAEAGSRTVEWTSGNVDKVVVDGQGCLTARSATAADETVTVTAAVKTPGKSDVTAAVKVKVSNSLRLNKTTLTLAVGETETLAASDYAGSVTWTSSAPAVATVDSNGQVRAASPGTATITATATGGAVQSCTVTVTSPANTLEFDVSSLTLDRGDRKTGTLTLKVFPGNTTDRDVAWTSSDTGLVTVSGSAQLTAGSDSAPATAAATVTVPDGAALGSAVITAVCGGKTAACLVTVGEIKVTAVELPDTLNLTAGGEAVPLTATVKPADATDKTLTWFSSNEGVATVTGSGGSVTVTPVSAGTARITAITKDGGVSGHCDVTVSAQPFAAVTGLSLNKAAITLEPGQKEQLIPTVNDGADPAVNWSTTEPGVATVLDGVVTAVAAGTATVTATSAADSAFSRSCTVTVRTPAESVTVSKPANAPEQLILSGPNTMELTAAVAPAGASQTVERWISTNESVLTVAKKEGSDSAALVTAVGGGTASVLAMTPDGKVSEPVAIQVRRDVTAVTLSEHGITLNPGSDSTKTFTLSAAVTPSDAYSTGVTWRVTAGSDVVSVDENGVVTALKAGTASVTAAAVGEDSGKNHPSDVCTVTVTTDPVTRLTLKQASLPLTTDAGAANHTGTVEADVKPTDGGTVTWEISDAAVATLSDTGGDSVTVTAIGPGTARLTAACGAYTASCVVTVSAVRVTGVTLSSQPASLDVGGTATLTAAVSPENADNKKLYWRSSDDSVASVAASAGSDAVATVTANGSGTAVIYVTAEDGGAGAACTVTVNTPVNGVTLNRNTLRLTAGGDTETLVATVSPAGATDRGVTWSSSDSAVASVENGVVTPHSAGTATVTVKTDDGNHTAQCAVTVTAPAVQSVEIRDGTDPITTLSLVSGSDAVTLTAAVTAQTGADTAVTWTSSDESVVRVVPNGASAAVTPLKQGRAAIVAAAGGVLAKCDVTVTSNVAGVTIAEADGIELTLESAATAGHFTANVTPVSGSQAYNGTVVWYSTDTSVAQVTPASTDSGSPVTVTAAGAGRAAIVAASADDGTILDSRLVTVYGMPTYISLSTNQLSLNAGRSWSLAATLSGQNPNPGVTWSSSNEDLVEVDANGLVTVKSNVDVTVNTTVTVTAKSKVRPELSAACAVTVERYVLDESLGLPVVGIEKTNGSATVTLTAPAEGQKIRYYYVDPTGDQPSREQPEVVPSGRQITVTSDAVLMVCVVTNDGSFRSVTVAANVNVSETVYVNDAVTVADPDGNGYTVQGVLADEGAMASVTLKGLSDVSNASVYMALYGEDGTMLGLVQRTVSVRDGGDAGGVQVEQFTLPDDIQKSAVKTIKFIILGVDSAGKGKVVSGSQTLT